MDAREIIERIRSAEKKTPVRVFLKERGGIHFGNVRRFELGNGCSVLFGDWKDVGPVLARHADAIEDVVVENDRCNSALPLKDLKGLPARIEPGAIIREGAEIGDRAVIMMGAVVNTGAVVGEGTMIDMNAVLGGRAVVGKNCHIGAGAVLAGVIEPESAVPVIVEDGVCIGANAVVLEGVHVGCGAVIAAGAVVTENVPPNSVAAGMPARVVKLRDAQTDAKTAIVEALREI